MYYIHGLIKSAETSSGSNHGRSSSGVVKFCNCHNNNMTVVETVVATKVAAAKRCKNGACRCINRWTAGQHPLLCEALDAEEEDCGMVR